MDWDFKQLARSEISKLLHGSIVPRPIAFVTTRNADASTNAAPFSFFNVLSTEPAVLAIGIDGREDSPDGLKDTARNIERDREFVVNMVDESLLGAMNLCAVDFPPDLDETVAAGLSLAPSVQIKTPRIETSPVQFECKVRELISLAPGRRIVIAEILHMHARNGLVNTRFHVDADQLNLVGRMEGAGWYARTKDRFQVPRLTYAQWLELNAS